MTIKTKLLSTEIPLTYFEKNEKENCQYRVLLLHGFGQKAAFMMNHCAPLFNRNTHIIAPNGPFPLLGRFPLEKSENDLIKGYAWYFYDAKEDRYLIDYKTPALLLRQLLLSFDDQLPLHIIGYSQGGYLAPFLIDKSLSIHKITAINASYRFDLIPSFSGASIEVNAINGELDMMVDPQLSHERFLLWQKRDHFTGNFYLIEDEGHRLKRPILEKLKELIP